MDFDDNFDASNQENDKERKQISHSKNSSSGDSNPKNIGETMLK